MPNHILEKAKKLAASGKLDEAGQILESAVEEHPDSPDLLAHLGYFYFIIGRYERAVRIFNHREQFCEPDRGICQIMETIFASRKDYRQQRKWLKKSRELGNRSLSNAVRQIQTYTKEKIANWRNKFIKLTRWANSNLNAYKRFCASITIWFVSSLEKKKGSPFKLSEYLRFYNRYDPAYPREAFAYHKNREAEIASQCLPIKNRQAIILDIGTGKNTLPLFWSSYETRIISLDGSLYGFSSLKAAQNKMEKDELPSNTDFIAGDALRLPFPDNLFDGVSALCAIEHIPGNGDIECMQEIYRVMKPGGKAVITVETSQYPHEIWMEVPYERGYQIDETKTYSGSKNDKTWHEVFCRNYSPDTMFDRLVETTKWEMLDWGFYDDRYLPLRRILDRTRHPVFSRILQPFQPVLAKWNYQQCKNANTLSPASIGFIVLIKNQ